MHIPNLLEYGSSIDYAKAVSVSAWFDEDPWQKYFTRFEEPPCRIIPVGSVPEKSLSSLF